MNEINQAENVLWSEDLPSLTDALEILYIQNNTSGRIGFAKSWPDLAAFVFGEELVQLDRAGTQDRVRRAALEQEAEERRAAILSLLATLQEKSLQQGILQLEYVREVIENYGRNIALHLYAPRIVDRFSKAPEPEKPEAEKIVQVKMPEMAEPSSPCEDTPHENKPPAELQVPVPPPEAARKKLGLRFYSIKDKE